MLKKLVLCAALLLAGCTSTTTPVTVQSIIDWVKTNCGYIVETVDVAALVTADPVAMTAAQIGKQICDAIQTQQSNSAGRVGSSGVVVVNNVPIHYSTQ